MKKKYQFLMILIMMVFFTSALRAEEAPEAFYDEGPTEPDNGPVAESTGHQTGVEVKKESLKPLWIAGIATWSAVYLAGIIATAAISEEEVRGKSVGYMSIPIVGPFIFLGVDGKEIIVDPKAPVVVSGIFQMAALGMVVAGLLIKRDVKSDPLTFGPSRKGAPRMSLLPQTMGYKGAGAVFTLSHF